MVDINDLKTSYERISNYLVETPILSSDSLNKQFEANIYLKNEVEQLTGSFKIRGALSALSHLKNEGVEGNIDIVANDSAKTFTVCSCIKPSCKESANILEDTIQVE